MRAIKGGNVPENAFSIIEGGLRTVQKTFKVVIKDLALNNKIVPGDLVHVYIRKLTEDRALDLGETRVLHDYRIGLDLKPENQITEGEIVAVYISKLSPDGSKTEIKKAHDYIEAGQRVIDSQGVISMKDIFKILNVNYRDCVRVYIRKPNSTTSIDLGTRRVLKKLQIVISDALPLYKLKENDVVIVYFKKIDEELCETKKEEIVIGSTNKGIDLYMEEKRINSTAGNYAESQS